MYLLVPVALQMFGEVLERVKGRDITDFTTRLAPCFPGLCAADTE